MTTFAQIKVVFYVIIMINNIEKKTFKLGGSVFYTIY